VQRNLSGRGAGLRLAPAVSAGAAGRAQIGFGELSQRHPGERWLTHSRPVDRTQFPAAAARGLRWGTQCLTMRSSRCRFAARLNLGVRPHVTHPDSSKHRSRSHAWRARGRCLHVAPVLRPAHGSPLATRQQPDRSNFGQCTPTLLLLRSRRRLRRPVLWLPSRCPERLRLALRPLNAPGSVAVVAHRGRATTAVVFGAGVGPKQSKQHWVARASCGLTSRSSRRRFGAQTTWQVQLAMCFAPLRSAA
jgi:hypothetical protein